MQALGAILLIGAYFAYCLTSLVMFMLIEKGTSIFLAFGIQNVIIILFLLLRLLFVKKRVSLPKNPKMIFIRAFTGILYSLCYFKALTYASFAEVGVLTNSFPIFIVLIAWIFLGEKVSIGQWIALGTGMIGVWFILIPGVDNIWNAGMIFAMIASLFWALSLIVMQKVADFEDFHTYLLFFFTFTLILLSPFMIANFFMPSYSDLLFYIATASLSLLAQSLIFQAYKICSAAELAPYNFSYALFHFLVAKGLFSFAPTKYFYIGAFLVLFGGIINLIAFEKRATIKKEPVIPSIDDDNT